MCRNIIQLKFPDRPPTEEELELAALQFVRKVTGYRKPSQANKEAFEDAISKSAFLMQDLFDELIVR